MSLVFDKWGRRRPVTEIAVGPCVVIAEKSIKKDGYHAYQLGFESQKNANKPQRGFLKKQKINIQPKLIREIKTDEKLNIGQIIKVDIFEPGDEVKIIGVSKGRGFAGVIKRHGFAGGPKTHGQSDRERAPGSIGQTTTPGRVYKGKRMAGHMGVDQVTVSGLEVIAVDKNKNSMLVNGAIPGYRQSLITIIKTGKVKGWTPPPAPEIKEEEEKEEEKKEETKQPEETNQVEQVNEVVAQKVENA